MIFFAPASSAMSISSPVPMVDAAIASLFAAPPTNVSPDARAISITAVPRCSRHSALHRIAERAGDRRRSVGPPSASSVPSPPSATGSSTQSWPSSQHADPTAAATWAPVAVPLNLSTAATTRTGRSLGFDAMGIANDIASLDATAQAELVRNGSASADELVEAAIEAAQRVNPQINAIIHPRYQAAAGEAPVSQRAVCRGADGGQRPRLHDEGRAVSPGFAGLEVGRLSARRSIPRCTAGSAKQASSPSVEPTLRRWAARSRPSRWPTARRAIRGTSTHSTGGSSGGSAAAVGSGHRRRRSRERRRRLDSACRRRSADWWA